MFRRPIAPIALTLLLGVLTVLMVVSIGRTRPAPLAIEVGFDVTPKDVEKRIRQSCPMVNFVKKGDDFTLRATDHKLSLISTVRLTSDAEAYRLLGSVSKKIIPVTDLATYFETMATIAETRGKPLVLVLYTDALDDGRDPDKVNARISAAARRLARAPRLRALIIAGTVRDVRPGWVGLPEMLAPAKAKLSIMPMEALDPDTIARLVKEARAGAASAAQEAGK